MLNSAVRLIQRTNLGGSSETMYYIGPDVHKKTISYCVKDSVVCAGVRSACSRSRRVHVSGAPLGSGAFAQGVTAAGGECPGDGKGGTRR
jgi:hypothetical protein